MLKKLTLLFSLCIICSCSIKQQKGYRFTNIEKARHFDVYNFTKEDVVGNFGANPIKLDENTWLYYSYVYKNPRFLKNKINEEKFLIVRFDDKDDVVAHNFVERKFTGKISNIEPSDKTIKEGILKELFNDVLVVPSE